MNDKIEYDPEITDEQKVVVSQLTDHELKVIDEALINNCCLQWRKVARVVMTTMSDRPLDISGIPDVFYTQRIKHLVAQGKLESTGDLNAMRYSEIKLPGEPTVVV